MLPTRYAARPKALGLVGELGQKCVALRNRRLPMIVVARGDRGPLPHRLRQGAEGSVRDDRSRLSIAAEQLLDLAFEDASDDQTPIPVPILERNWGRLDPGDRTDERSERGEMPAGLSGEDALQRLG